MISDVNELDKILELTGEALAAAAAEHLVALADHHARLLVVVYHRIGDAALVSQARRLGAGQYWAGTGHAALAH